jgi:Protein of unknown function (DUF3644)
MSLSHDLAQKAVQAAIAAIEIYNKPDFHFREEAFSLLMTNSWELLLKGKWLADHGEDVTSLYEYDNSPTDPAKKKLRVNRCGNPITFGLIYLANKLCEDKNSGLEKPCLDNLLALVEVRDTSAHFLNKDLYFGRRILEIGTASLQNFLGLVTEWFQLDLSRYNFFLMPLSFYHGFEAVVPVSMSSYPEQMQRLLAYFDILESAHQQQDEQTTRQSFSLRLETHMVRGKDTQAIAFRWTDDPCAPAVALREEDVLKAYPWTYRVLTDNLKKRYSDFLENNDYHTVRRNLETNKKLVLTRSLHPDNPTTSKQRFYSPNIVSEFDKHYQRRTKA